MNDSLLESPATVPGLIKETVTTLPNTTATIAIYITITAIAICTSVQATFCQQTFIGIIGTDIDINDLSACLAL